MQETESITLTFGPPRPEDLKRTIKERAAEIGESEDETFVAFGQDILRSLAKRGKDGRSGFDWTLSTALGQYVTVHEPFIGYCLLRGGFRPVVTFEAAKIVDADGRPVRQDQLRPGLPQQLAFLLARYIKSDWVHSFGASPGVPWNTDPAKQ